MNKEEIEKKRLEVLDYLQESSHDFHQVFANAMAEYGKTEMKLIDDNLNFGYKIIQVTAIVAGFGFTGILGVKTIPFFVSGEFLLMLSIVYGVKQIQKIYASNLESIQKSSNKSYVAFDKKSRLYIETIKSFLKSGEIDVNQFQDDLEVVDQELLKAIRPEVSNKRKDEGTFLNTLILILVSGAFFLLLSFADINFLYTLLVQTMN